MGDLRSHGFHGQKAFHAETRRRGDAENNVFLRGPAPPRECFSPDSRKALCGTMPLMSEAPLPMREHALDNIRFIRDAMERAGSFTSIPGWGGVGVGVTAIGAAIVAQQFLGKSLRMWLATWLAEAIVAAAIGFGTMAMKARRSEAPFMSGASKRLARASSEGTDRNVGIWLDIPAGDLKRHDRLISFDGPAAARQITPADFQFSILYGVQK